MNTNPVPNSPNPGEDSHIEVSLGYQKASQMQIQDGKEILDLAGNIYRTAVNFHGRIKNPILVREALSALYDVVKSDFRYVPKDRAAYQAYMLMKKQSASLSMVQARQAYFQWLLRNDPLAFLILDPVITVHPEEIFCEVFSKDEGTYAKVSIKHQAFLLEGKVQCGTTNIDYTTDLYNSIQRMRSYHDSWLTINSDAIKITGDNTSVVEKKIKLPASWMRGFLQLQSASTLPYTSVFLNPIDFYNVLRQLRFNADKKKGGRAIRVELMPGEVPRLVMEPWEKLVTTHSDVYTSTIPKVVKIWGRRRFSLLNRMLPFTQKLELKLLGSGLPSFLVLYAGDVTFTLGITGFTSSDWSKAASFDLLLPRANQVDTKLESVMKYLSKQWYATSEQISKATGIKGAELQKLLQSACQQGKVIYDFEYYRFRPLTEDNLDLSKLEFRNLRERVAFDLLAQQAVHIEQENFNFGIGLEVVGKAIVKAEKREYRPLFVLDDDGRLKKAECTCSLYRERGLKEGPCSHIIALRLLYSLEDEKRRLGQSIASVETRVFSRRNKEAEEIVQLSLNHRKLKKRWGKRGENLRMQNTIYNSERDAQVAFSSQIKLLESKKYLDITR